MIEAISTIGLISVCIGQCLLIQKLLKTLEEANKQNREMLVLIEKLHKQMNSEPSVTLPFFDPRMSGGGV